MSNKAKKSKKGVVVSPASFKQDLNANMIIHKDGEDWTLSVSFEHDPATPDCDASGGAFYSTVLSLTEAEREMTGTHSVSIDYSPCGHPDPAFWGVGHYDVHYFLQDPATIGGDCEGFIIPPGTPCSDPFFEPQTMDMPADFVADPIGVKGQGVHLFKPPTVPAAEWNVPDVILGTYGGTLSFYELMFPYTSMMKNQDFSDTVEYENQSTMTLPGSYTASFGDGKVMLFFKGKVKGHEDSSDDQIALGNTSTPPPPASSPALPAPAPPAATTPLSNSVFGFGSTAFTNNPLGNTFGASLFGGSSIYGFGNTLQMPTTTFGNAFGNMYGSPISSGLSGNSLSFPSSRGFGQPSAFSAPATTAFTQPQFIMPQSTFSSNTVFPAQTAFMPAFSGARLGGFGFGFGR